MDPAYIRWRPQHLTACREVGKGPFQNMSICCAAGSAAPGTFIPRGEIKQIVSIEVYISHPESAQGCRGTLLLLPDGFGLARHNFMLADAFAKHGWRVYLPDYFEGDPLPIAILREGMKVVTADETASEVGTATFNIAAWLQRHTHVRIQEILGSVIASIKAENVASTLFGVGYCFGGKYLLRLARNDLKAAVAFHPSFVEKADVQSIHIPLFVGLGELDDMVPRTLADDIRAWTQPRIESQNDDFVIAVYPGMRHGFAARPDSADKEVYSQYQAALSDTISFLAQHS